MAKEARDEMAGSAPHAGFRARLRQESDYLRSMLSNAEDRIRQLNIPENSQADDILADCDCEYLTEAYKWQRERLKSVVESLARIEEGTFGLCVGCNRPIGKKRLKVLPSARYCLSCQEQLEQDARYSTPSGRSLLVTR